MRSMDRRAMIERTFAVVAGAASASRFPIERMDEGTELTMAPRVRFGVVGVNHGHIYGMGDAATRGLEAAEPRTRVYS